ncbi:hypothetical protein [Streptomyces sp. NPDC048191]|uniref:hypothetical protein n=1 Tax=Streptomyces sp. NPDC048191 TaxID=3155484 RepID=UPI0033C7F9C1
MSNYDDLKHFEESAESNREYAERMRQRRSEARAKGESTGFYDDEIRRAEARASKDAETAMKIRGWIYAGAPTPSDPSSVANRLRRELAEMEDRMRRPTSGPDY